MLFDDFKIVYAETMMYYQLIENDIKCIYAFMLEGNVDNHFEEIENKTLGQMIRILKELDNEDGNSLISAGDYNFLSQICDNRNHWAHNVFTEFVYVDNWEYSKEYKKQCNKLNKDHDRVQEASQILEKIRIEYCTNIMNMDKKEQEKRNNK